MTNRSKHAGDKRKHEEENAHGISLFDGKSATAVSKRPKKGKGMESLDVEEEETGASEGTMGTEGAGGDEEVDPGCPIVSSRDVNEADNAVRKHYRIKVAGYDPPAPLRSFQQLVTKLAAPSGLLRNIRENGYEQPTPIQRQAIPVIMAGRELLAVAPTGSGKTMVGWAAARSLLGCLALLQFRPDMPLPVL